MTGALPEELQIAAVLMDTWLPRLIPKSFCLQLCVNKDVICSMGAAVYLGNASKSACLSILFWFFGGVSTDLSSVLHVYCYF